MHARVTTIEGSPDRMDAAARHVRERTLPQLRQMDGFEGFVAFGDRQSGRLMGVAFWESEEALRATEQAASGVRGGAVETAGGAVASVEEYEVFALEAPSSGPVGGVTDTVGGVTDTVSGTAGNLLGGGEKKG